MKKNDSILFISAHGNTPLPNKYFQYDKNLYFLCNAGKKISSEEVQDYLDKILTNTIDIEELKIKHTENLETEQKSLEELNIILNNNPLGNNGGVSSFIKKIIKTLDTQLSEVKKGYFEHNLTPDSGELSSLIMMKFMEYKLTVSNVLYFGETEVFSPFSIAFNKEELKAKIFPLTFVGLILTPSDKYKGFTLSSLLETIKNITIYLKNDDKTVVLLDPPIEKIPVDIICSYQINNFESAILGDCRSYVLDSDDF